MKRGLFFGLAAVLVFFATVFSLQLISPAQAQTGTWVLDAASNLVTALGVGNVGIGTSQAPDRPLTVQGSGGLVSFKDGSGATKWHISNGLGNWSLVQSGVDNAIVVGAQTRSVGIGGIPDPLARLDVNGGIKIGGGINESVVTSPGMIYFNGTNLRCRDGGQWKNCVGGGSTGGGVGFIAPATANLLTKWDTTGATLTNSNIADNGNLVLVGKSLSVTGNLSVSGVISSGSGVSPSCTAGQVLSGQKVQGGIVTDGTCVNFVSSTPGFSYWDKDPVLAKIFTTTGIDTVAIGTSGPTRPPVPLTIKAKAGASSWIQLQDNAGADKWHFTAFGGGFSFVETGVPGGDGRLFIKAGTGNVGMGTINPGAKLEISTPTNNALRLRRSNPGSIDVFTAVGNGTGETLCGAPTAGACLAAFDSSRSSIGCTASGAIRALCAAVGD
ncbi:MAG: hypothetical protein AAB691_04825 [Patescibacteria group bacterium]